MRQQDRIEVDELFANPPEGKHRYVGESAEPCRACGRGALTDEHVIFYPGEGALKAARDVRNKELDEMPHWQQKPVECADPSCGHFDHQHHGPSMLLPDPDRPEERELHTGIRPCRKCACKKLRSVCHSCDGYGVVMEGAPCGPCAGRGWR